MTKSTPGREARVRAIALAIRRVETGRVRNVPRGTRMSISAVAREAAIDPATIHTTYPDLAERIRELAGRATRAQRDEKASTLKAVRKQNVALRAEVASLKAELAAIASRFATQKLEVTRLRSTS